jgi:hypothetical protein
VLLVVLRVAGVAPAETVANPDLYADEDDDEFVPASDKENFDVFDWQLCKVREDAFTLSSLLSSYSSSASLFYFLSFIFPISSPSLSPSCLLILSIHFLLLFFCILLYLQHFLLNLFLF